MSCRPGLRSIALLLLATVAAAVSAQTPAPVPADLHPTSLARLPYLERKDVDEAGQKIFDIFDRSPGRTPEEALSGPLAFAAYNVPVAQALLDLHDAAVGKGTLNPHVRELAILVRLALPTTTLNGTLTRRRPPRPVSTRRSSQRCAATVRSRASRSRTPP